MKDVFIPIILFATTLVTTIIFLTGVYKPQQQTLEIVAESEQSKALNVTINSSTKPVEVSGTVVMQTIDYYSKDSAVTVNVKKGGSTASFITNKYSAGPDAGGSISVQRTEKYIKETIRNSENKVSSINFTLK